MVWQSLLCIVQAKIPVKIPEHISKIVDFEASIMFLFHISNTKPFGHIGGKIITRIQLPN
jgi:hypothetical protein